MKKRRTVRMTFGDWGGNPEILEARLVLSGAGARSAVVASALSGSGSRNARALRISERVDAAFNSFTRDYLDAQAAYLQAIQANPASSSPFANVFKNVVNQRVNLLSQELIRAMSQLPNATVRVRGESETPLEAFLRRRITDPDASNSLRSALTADAALPIAAAADISAGAALYALSATNAIDAARASTINAAKFLVGGVFAPKKR